MSASETQGELTNFLDFVKTILPKDKFNMFLSLFTFPTPCVSLTNAASNELHVVYEAENPIEIETFKDSKTKEDSQYYKTEYLNEPNSWNQKSWQAVKTAINSVLVVDVAKDKFEGRPAPYYYMLPIDSVHCYDHDRGLLEWIVFEQDDDKFAVFDDKFYRIVKLGTNSDIIVESEVSHNLGFCPAKFFWTSPLTSRSEDVKKSPFSSEVGALKWYLYHSISKRALDLSSAWPITVTYAEDCDFKNMETGSYCDGGFLRNRDDDFLLGNISMNGEQGLIPCPACQNKRLRGPGSLIEMPIPTKGDYSGEDVMELREPVKIVGVDTDALDYHVRESVRLKKEIFDSIVGAGGDVLSRESINEDQVNASFASKTNAIMWLKKNLEAAKEFAFSTIFKLRYGDGFVGLNYDMGNEFFLQTIDDLNRKLAESKANGASSGLLGSISDQIIATEYKNNPVKLERMRMLKQLEPYANYTLTDLSAMNQLGAIDLDLLKLKINFQAYIDRFERENVSITEFGDGQEYYKRVETITNTLMSYVKNSDN